MNGYVDNILIPTVWTVRSSVRREKKTKARATVGHFVTNAPSKEISRKLPLKMKRTGCVKPLVVKIHRFQTSKKQKSQLFFSQWKSKWKLLDWSAYGKNPKHWFFLSSLGNYHAQIKQNWEHCDKFVYSDGFVTMFWSETSSNFKQQRLELKFQLSCYTFSRIENEA